MDPLVIQLQRDALDSSISVSDLLRKALLVATKLNLTEFQTWLRNELDGYTDSKLIPPYRRLQGEVMGFNPFQGWIPIFFQSAELQKKASETFTNQPIGEIEGMNRQITSASHMEVPLPIELTKHLMNQFPIRSASLHVSPTCLSAILEIVRNTVLNWALQLEKDGILGAGLAFSENEKQIANKSVYIVSNYFGNISHSQIQQSPSQSTQTMTSQGSNPTEIQGLLRHLEETVNAMARVLPDDAAEQARRDLSVLTTEANSKAPRKQWYELSTEGLKKAAKDAKEGGAPVLELAGKVLLLLNTLNHTP
jgi:hypothetical protein